MTIVNHLQLLQKLARSRGRDGRIVTDNDETITIDELLQRARAVSHLLQKDGVRPGNHVAILLPNSSWVWVACVAVWARGAVPVLLNPALTAAELEYILDHARPKVVIGSDDCVAAATEAHTRIADGPSVIAWHTLASLRHAPVPTTADDWVEPDDVAVVLYTSGTTGRPKGVMIRHEGLLFCSQAYARFCELTERDVVLCIVPAFHVYGVLLLSCALMSGSRIVLRTFSSARETLIVLSNERVTVFPGVPFLFQTLVEYRNDKEEFDTSSLRLLLSSAAPFPPEMAAALQQRFGPLPIYDGYGMTETSTVVTIGPSTVVEKPRSVGRPIDGVHIRICDEGGAALEAGAIGDIWVRTPALMKGYYKDAAAVERAVRDGWYRTGDTGYVDSAGYLYLAGRSSDVVNVGGMKVYPQEVENCMRQWPEIRQVAVVGIAAQGIGEMVTAFVVPLAGRPIDKAALQRFLSERLASYKLPSHIEVIDEMPTTASGKILKGALKERVSLPGPTVQTLAEEPRLVEILSEEVERIVDWRESYRVPPGASLREIGLTSALAVALSRGFSKRLNIDVPVGAVLNYQSIEELAGYIREAANVLTRTDGEGPRRRHLDANVVQQLKEDSLFRVTASARPAKAPGQTATLLTGATGFFGSWLLQELLAQRADVVHCLVRASSEEAAFRRLQEASERYCARALAPGRIRVHLGEQALPRLGLSEQAWSDLGNEVTDILHDGARVNFSLPYASLRAENVGSTVQLLKLAAFGCKKSLHFVSSFAALSSSDKVIDFDVNPPNSGYGQCKAVAEKMLEGAAATGQSIGIYRVALLFPSPTGGNAPSASLFFALLAACVELRCAPQLRNARVYGISVDRAARAVIASMTARTSRGPGLAYVMEPRPLAWSEVMETLREVHPDITPRDLDDWVSTLRSRAARAGASGKLAALAAMFSRTVVDDWAFPIEPSDNPLLTQDLDPSEGHAHLMAQLRRYVAGACQDAATR